jgi:hypothetical protein
MIRGYYVAVRDGKSCGWMYNIAWVYFGVFIPVWGWLVGLHGYIQRDFLCFPVWAG